MQEIYEHNTIKFNWGRRFFKKTPSPIELCFFLVRFSPICHMFCWFSAINTFIRNHRFIFDQTSCSSSACLIFHFAFTYWISTPTCFYESAVCCEFFFHLVHRYCCIDVCFQELFSPYCTYPAGLFQESHEVLLLFHLRTQQSSRGYLDVLLQPDYFQCLLVRFQYVLGFQESPARENFHPGLFSESSIFTLYPAFFSSSSNSFAFSSTPSLC